MQDEQEMEAIRRLSLTKMEEHYAMRMEELVNDMQLASAESIMEEMTYTGEEIDDCDVFLDDLTDWLEDGTDLRFYNKE
tara:strand:- start:799 stop:1035 length:237 start_codon:yes stop_codon:yes gene_type:complete